MIEVETNQQLKKAQSDAQLKRRGLIKCPQCGMVVKETYLRCHIKKVHRNIKGNARKERELSERRKQYGGGIVDSYTPRPSLSPAEIDYKSTSTLVPCNCEVRTGVDLMQIIRGRPELIKGTSKLGTYVECPYCGVIILKTRLQSHVRKTHCKPKSRLSTPKGKDKQCKRRSLRKPPSPEDIQREIYGD